MLETMVFYITLLFIVGVSLTIVGVDFTRLARIKWGRIARIIIILGMGIMLCIILGNISTTLGFIGLLVGMLLGVFLTVIISYAWKSSNWWMRLLLIATIITGIISAIFAK